MQAYIWLDSDSQRHKKQGFTSGTAHSWLEISAYIGASLEATWNYT